MTPRRSREPRLELVESYWRFQGPNGRTFECGIYRTDVGLELRAGYGPADLIRSQFAIEMGAARAIDAEWKQAVIGKGFHELPSQG